MQDKSKQWTLSQLSGYHIAKQNKKERMPWLFTIYMASSTLGKWWAKLRTGIVFNICTIQFLLPKTAAKAYKKLRFHNGTRIHVCNIPSFVPQNFPLERPKPSCFIHSFSSRISGNIFVNHSMVNNRYFHTTPIRHMWVEFVVGSLHCSGRFFSESSGFPSPQKPTLLNSNSIWNAQTRFIEFLRTPNSSVGWLFTVPYFSLWWSRYSESYR